MIIKEEYETKYERGDIVIFERDGCLLVGLIINGYIDHSAGDTVWYSIRINKYIVYDYSNGDISETSIIRKIEDSDDIKKRIIEGDE